MKNVAFKTVTTLVLTLMLAPLALASQTHNVNLNVRLSHGVAITNFELLSLGGSLPPGISFGGPATHESKLPAGSYKNAFYINSTADNPFGGKIMINFLAENDVNAGYYWNSNYTIESNGHLASASGSFTTNNTLKPNGAQAGPGPMCSITLIPGIGNQNDTINITC